MGCQGAEVMNDSSDQIYHVALEKKSGEVVDIWVVAKSWDEAKEKLKRGDVTYSPPDGYPLHS